MHKYANISKVSGVESYECSPTFSYLVVKFKDGEVLTYPARLNSVNQIRSMSVFAELGIGLHRYLTKNKPVYYQGMPAENDNGLLTSDQEKLNISKISYPTYNFKTIRWNNGKDWVEISFKDGDTRTYTIESCGKRNVINLIKYAIEGKGLKQYIDENKPTAVEDTVNETIEN